MKKLLALVALVAALGASSASAATTHTGKVVFNGGCAASNVGTCTFSVTGISGAGKLFAAPTLNGNYSSVTRTFTAPANRKRIANASNNKCFYFKKNSGNARTNARCL